MIRLFSTVGNVQIQYDIGVRLLLSILQMNESS